MTRTQKKYDLYSFVARAALEKGEPFPLKCNCGGVVTIMPPFQDEYVVCPVCESKIRMLVIEGDPGYGSYEEKERKNFRRNDEASLESSSKTWFIEGGCGRHHPTSEN